ncbi:hypothetical protein VKT23_015163 [Stygiomarasmius scandens]|uniref:Transmembrane protein n=1 Tax=Marasmiellus scandens TaxID=2682957 RepID=A0ABR1J216_9AGAR
MFSPRLQMILMVFLVFFNAALAAPTSTSDGNNAAPVNFTQVFTEKECVQTCQPVSMNMMGNGSEPSANENTCKDPMPATLQKCLQCGFDFVPGLSNDSVIGFLQNFTNSCKQFNSNINIAPIQTNAASEVRGVVLMSLVAMSIGILFSIV